MISPRKWLARRRALKAQSGVVDSSEERRGNAVWEALTGGNTGAPTANEALGITAVYACVNLISGAISSMPMHVYDRSDDGDLNRAVNDPLWWVLNEEFSPRWSAAAGWSFLMVSKLLHGDGFAQILRGSGGAVVGLVPIHPSRVRVIATSDGSRLIYEVQPDPTIVRPNAAMSAVKVLDQDDMLHVPGFGFNGLRSPSVLRHALRVPGRLAINAQDFSAKFLENSARPDFALQAAGELTDEQFDRLRETVNEHIGPTNTGKPIILEGGLSVETLTMPLEDAQLLETRQFQVEEIARIYGVPPFMIGHTAKTTSWGSGVESMGSGFVRFALRDHLNAIHNEMNRKFFRNPKKVAEFDTTELERGDMKSLVDTVRIALGRAGEQQIMTLAEGRHLLRLPKNAEGLGVNEGNQTNEPNKQTDEPASGDEIERVIPR